MIRVLALVAMLLFSTHVFADTTCKESMLEDFVKTNLDFSDWNSFYNFYSKYAPCGDDGAFAEGYSASVVNLFGQHWDQLDELPTLIKKHPYFKKFVLLHLDGSVSKEEIDQIIKLSSSSCPSVQLNLCKEINRRAVAVKNGAL